MVHIYYSNVISGENSYSKLSLIDLAGSDGQILEEDSGERVTDLLHVMKSLSAYVIFTIIFPFIVIIFSACLPSSESCMYGSYLSGLPPCFWEANGLSIFNAFTLIVTKTFTLTKIYQLFSLYVLSWQYHYYNKGCCYKLRNNCPSTLVYGKFSGNSERERR